MEDEPKRQRRRDLLKLSLQRKNTQVKRWLGLRRAETGVLAAEEAARAEGGAPADAEALGRVAMGGELVSREERKSGDGDAHDGAAREAVAATAAAAAAVAPDICLAVEAEAPENASRRALLAHRDSSGAVSQSSGRGFGNSCSNLGGDDRGLGTGGILAAELPPGHRHEMLVDPIPPSDRHSLVGLSQTWKNMRHRGNDSEPGMQLLHGSLELIVRFLLGRRGGVYWDAFFNNYDQFASASQVLGAIECFLAGSCPARLVPGSLLPGAAAAEVSPPPPPSQAPEAAEGGEGAALPDSAAPAAGAAGAAGAESSKTAEGANPATGSVSGPAAGPGDSAEPYSAEPDDSGRRELYLMQTSDDGIIVVNSRPVAEGKDAEPDPNGAETLRRVVTELGLDADPNLLVQHAHSFLVYWLQEGFGGSKFTEQDVQEARRLLETADRLLGVHDETLAAGAREDALDSLSEPDATLGELWSPIVDCRGGSMHSLPTTSTTAPATSQDQSRLSPESPGPGPGPGTAGSISEGSSEAAAALSALTPPASTPLALSTGGAAPPPSQVSSPVSSIAAREPLVATPPPPAPPPNRRATSASAGSEARARSRSNSRYGRIGLNSAGLAGFKLQARSRSLSHGWKRRKSPLNRVGAATPADGRGPDSQLDRDLRGFKPAQVAQCLTWMLFCDVYRYIEAKDLVTKEARDNSPCVQRMIETFDLYAWWPLSWIMNRNIDVLEQVERVVFFLDVATECRRLCNFHAFFGIVAGLSQPLMKWVWEFMKEKDRVRFEHLKRAVRNKGDYLVYRADLSKCANKSHIPFLGLATKLLFPLEHSIAARNPHRDHMVNFGRCVSIQNTVDDFLRGQCFPYESDLFGSGRDIEARLPPPPPAPTPAPAIGEAASVGAAPTAHSVHSPQGAFVRPSIAVSEWSAGSLAGSEHAAGAHPRSPDAAASVSRLSMASVPFLGSSSFHDGGHKARGGSFASGSASALPAATRLWVDERLIHVIEDGMQRARPKTKLERDSNHLKKRLCEGFVEKIELIGF